MKLEPKAKKIQLERGSWLHVLLQTHYDGEDWKRAHKRLTTVFYDLFEEQREELGDLPDECLRIMRSYLRYWKNEDQFLIPVDSELDEIVTLPNGLEFHIIVDLIMEDRRTGILWPFDHKSRKSFESSDNMLLDPQLSNYYWALRIMGYKPLGGVVYNEIRTKPPTVPKLTARTGQLSRRRNIDTDVYTFMSQIKRYGFDPSDYADILRHLARTEHERFFRRVKLPKDPPLLRTMRRELVYSAREIANAERANAFPRSFNKQCRWDCDFRNICIAELMGGDISSMIKMNFRRRTREDQIEKERPWQQD